MNNPLPDAQFFHTLADAADKTILAYYRQSLTIETKYKQDVRFDPVTQADRQAEHVIRDLIGQRYPEHAILGEEFGENDSQSLLKWVIDPIDGTRPFICGLPVWGSLIGLQQAQIARMGMMSQPFTQERFWADGEHSWTSGPMGHSQLLTRQNATLANSILHTTSPELYPLHPQVKFAELTQRVLMTRYGGECYAMAMLAAGRIDLCLELSLQPYDIVAFIPIIEQAGGVVTTLQGHRAEAGGQILASANRALHDAALAVLNGE